MNRYRSQGLTLVGLLFLLLSLAAAQDKKEKPRSDIMVQVETLDMQGGLPGAGTTSVAPVGGNFGKETRTDKDKQGNLVYVRTMTGRSQWLTSGIIEVTLQITENGTARTETIQIENFEPKILVLRENPDKGWREVVRIIPLFRTQLCFGQTSSS